MMAESTTQQLARHLDHLDECLARLRALDVQMQPLLRAAMEGRRPRWGARRRLHRLSIEKERVRDEVVADYERIQDMAVEHGMARGDFEQTVEALRAYGEAERLERFRQTFQHGAHVGADSLGSALLRRRRGL